MSKVYHKIPLISLASSLADIQSEADFYGFGLTGYLRC